MIFNAFQREDDDKVFTVVRNVTASALAVGAACVWDSGASADGVRVTAAAATTFPLFRGVVAETSISASGYGKVQVHGKFTDANVFNSTDVIAAAGSVLRVSTGGNYLEPILAAGTGYEGFVYSLEAVVTATTPVTNDIDVLIRAM